jgi:hypothetical protein
MNILHVKAGVRYWEDATVSGVIDEHGTLIPFRVGDYWCPTIDIERGIVLNWPQGVTADVHYKVCDDGEYWLGTDSEKLARWCGEYVPEDYLCHGDEGYGDYIILRIDGNGSISSFLKPMFHEQRWRRTAV